MIKKLENKNIDEIMKLWLKATIKAHPFINENYWKDSYVVVKDIYIPIADTFIYEENNKIKGFIAVIENSYIGALFVDPEYQGKGIGKKLIEYAENIYDSLRLAVYKENHDSVNFYKKVGFKITGEGVNEETKALEYYMSNN
nr:N-acetyltransferase [uncultured Cetobacterium sp.]